MKPTEFYCVGCNEVLPMKHESWQEPNICRRCYAAENPQRRPHAVRIVLLLGVAFALVLWWVAP